MQEAGRVLYRAPAFHLKRVKVLDDLDPSNSGSQLLSGVLPEISLPEIHTEAVTLPFLLCGLVYSFARIPPNGGLLHEPTRDGGASPLSSARTFLISHDLTPLP